MTSNANRCACAAFRSHSAGNKQKFPIFFPFRFFTSPHPPFFQHMATHSGTDAAMQRQMEFDAKRLERSRALNKLFNRADSTIQRCRENIREAIRCENSEDEDEEEVKIETKTSSESSFHYARRYGDTEAPQKKMVTSLLAMDPQEQEKYMVQRLEEHEARWGPNARTMPKLTFFQKCYRFFNPGPNSVVAVDRFFRACLNGDLRKVEKFVDEGGDPTCVDADGRNGIYYACVEGNIDVCKYLYRQRVEISPVMKINGFSPLHVCAVGASRDHRNVGAWLMSRKGTDVDVKDNNNVTPLMRACQRGNVSFVRMLLNGGAEHGAQDLHKWTPLHYACYHGHTKCVNALIEDGVKLKLKDEDGNTGLDWAERMKFYDIVELIIDYQWYIKDQRSKG